MALHKSTIWNALSLMYNHNYDLAHIQLEDAMSHDGSDVMRGRLQLATALLYRWWGVEQGLPLEDQQYKLQLARSHAGKGSSLLATAGDASAWAMAIDVLADVDRALAPPPATSLGIFPLSFLPLLVICCGHLWLAYELLKKAGVSFGVLPTALLHTHSHTRRKRGAARLHPSKPPLRKPLVDAAAPHTFGLASSSSTADTRAHGMQHQPAAAQLTPPHGAKQLCHPRRFCKVHYAEVPLGPEGEAQRHDRRYRWLMRYADRDTLRRQDFEALGLDLLPLDVALQLGATSSSGNSSSPTISSGNRGSQGTNSSSNSDSNSNSNSNRISRTDMSSRIDTSSDRPCVLVPHHARPSMLRKVMGAMACAVLVGMSLWLMSVNGTRFSCQMQVGTQLTNEASAAEAFPGPHGDLAALRLYNDYKHGKCSYRSMMKPLDIQTYLVPALAVELLSFFVAPQWPLSLVADTIIAVYSTWPLLAVYLLSSVFFSWRLRGSHTPLGMWAFATSLLVATCFLVPDSDMPSGVLTVADALLCVGILWCVLYVELCLMSALRHHLSRLIWPSDMVLGWASKALSAKDVSVGADCGSWWHTTVIRWLAGQQVATEALDLVFKARQLQIEALPRQAFNQVVEDARRRRERRHVQPAQQQQHAGLYGVCMKSLWVQKFFMQLLARYELLRAALEPVYGQLQLLVYLLVGWPASAREALTREPQLVLVECEETLPSGTPEGGQQQQHFWESGAHALTAMLWIGRGICAAAARVVGSCVAAGWWCGCATSALAVRCLGRAGAAVAAVLTLPYRAAAKLAQVSAGVRRRKVDSVHMSGAHQQQQQQQRQGQHPRPRMPQQRHQRQQPLSRSPHQQQQQQTPVVQQLQSTTQRQQRQQLPVVQSVSQGSRATARSPSQQQPRVSVLSSTTSQAPTTAGSATTNGLAQGQRCAPDPAGAAGLEDDSSLCVACLDAPRCVGVLHSGTVHLVFCRECAARHDLRQGCPTCRAAVEQYVAVYV